MIIFKIRLAYLGKPQVQLCTADIVGTVLVEVEVVAAPAVATTAVALAPVVVVEVDNCMRQRLDHLWDRNWSYIRWRLVE